jgi:hypothetical protein
MKLLFRIRTSLNEFYFEKLVVSSGGTLENHSRTTRVRPAATLPCVFSFSHETFYVLLFVIYDLGSWVLGLGPWFFVFGLRRETARRRTVSSGSNLRRHQIKSNSHQIILNIIE